jgi:hypothetical protein
LPGVWVITPSAGLLPVDTVVTRVTLERFARVDIDPRVRSYRQPLTRDARRLAEAAGPEAEFILLGSVASGKYIEPLAGILRPLRFPPAFVGRGDMSRGGLMLRQVREERELPYGDAAESPRRGPRPPRLPRQRSRPPGSGLSRSPGGE